jgi:tetratricopeptide (TPR) repeat protein
VVLHGRDRERERIGVLINEAWSFRGGALVLRGQPGVGKSTLLREALSRAEGMQVLASQGVESESPLAFAALQRLLRPAMRHTEQLPAPQAHALRAAFGEEAESSGDRFLVFLATLSLLAEAAEDAPVLCLIDDAHWLDDASSAALMFVARRLGPERIALLFAAREGDVRRFYSEGVPDLAIGGLDVQAAGALLDERAGLPVPPAVRDALMRQTGGNPLALVELPSALSAAQLSGDRALPAELPLTEEVQRVFLDRCRHLSPEAQTVLLVAAADDTTRAAIVRQAGARLGAGPGALEEAERSGLLQVHGSHVELRHPLVRSAIYQGVTSSARREAHAALAQAMVAAEDADRRAWHLAASVDEPDDTVVAELEGAAQRAQRRGGYEAASSALERAAELTVDDEDRAKRLFAASMNGRLGGQLPRALALAEDARHRTSDPLLRADIDRLRGRVEFSVGSVPAAIRIWTQAARDVATADEQRAREIAMIATAGSTFVGAGDRTDLDPSELSGGVGADSGSRERCFAALLVGFHGLLHGDFHNATTSLRAALDAGKDLTETDLLTNMGIAAFHLGDDNAFRRSFSTLLAQSRDSGAVGLVLFALPRLALAELAAGQWSSATATATEALQLARSVGQDALTAMPLAELALHAAHRGEEEYDVLLRQLDEVMASQTSTGILGVLVEDARRSAQACRDALAGQPASALHHLENMTQPSLMRLAAYDRLDTAARAGYPETAAAWLAELEVFAAEVASPRARAVVAYGRALASAGATAEAHFRSALEHQANAARPFEAARTHLAYGAFLRRTRRRVDAREHLRAALNTFEDIGAQP